MQYYAWDSELEANCRLNTVAAILHHGREIPFSAVMQYDAIESLGEPLTLAEERMA
jgi:hypothetical protein